MKKFKFCLLLLTISGMAFTSCDFSDSLSGVFRGYNTTTATKTKNWTYSSSNPVFEVDSSTARVDISGIPGGKNIYLAKVNPSKSTFLSSDVRYVTNSGYIRAVSAPEASDGVSPQFNMDSLKNHDHMQFPDYSKIPLIKGSAEASSRAISSAQINQTVPQKTLSVGSTTKTLYVDLDPKENVCVEKSATLRATGTYCNVWIIDDYYDSGAFGISSGKKVKSSVAKQLAQKFDTIYPHIHNIFGNESDEMFYSYNYLTGDFSTAPMTYLSDIGTKVNIVLFDINNDADTAKGSGTVGYFNPADYYPNEKDVKTINSGLFYPSGDLRNYSNEGKYFYVDSYVANESIEDIFSTLAHEFQHMVNFSVKTIQKGLMSSSYYDEMLSVLCEDVMFDTLGISSENDVQHQRLGNFNALYYLSGMQEYRNDELAAVSYATLYMFGAWLCREYGGATLIRNIMTNSYIDEESILAAVGRGKTMETLVKEFCSYLVSGETLNEVTKTINGYSYRMKAIDLWNSDFNASDYIGTTVGNGPVFLRPDVQVNLELRSGYGVTLHNLGYLEKSGDIGVIFSSNGASDLKMYLIVR